MYLFKISSSVQIFILAAVINYTGYAQPLAVQWQKYLGGSGIDKAHSIRQTKDNGYIIAGASFSNDKDVSGNHGNQDYWIVKMDHSGAIEWQKPLGGSKTDIGHGIQQTTEGGYIVSGTSNSNDGDVSGNHGGYDIWIVKLDAKGGIQWKKSYGGTKNEIGYSIEQTLDGGYIVMGISDSKDGDVTENYGKFDIWILKLNSSGVIQWQKSLSEREGENQIAYSIKQTKDKGYILVGNIGERGQGKIWVVKLDGAGLIQWQQTYGPREFAQMVYAYEIQETTDGGYVVVESERTLAKKGEFDCKVLKLNNLGKIQWEKTIPTNIEDHGFSIQQTHDGGYIIVGVSADSRDTVGSPGPYNGWLVKLDHLGLIQWQKFIGGKGDDQTADIQQTKDGGYIIVGSSTSNSHNGTVKNIIAYDYWVIKISPTILSSENSAPLKSEEDYLLKGNNQQVVRGLVNATNILLKSSKALLVDKTVAENMYGGIDLLSEKINGFKFSIGSEGGGGGWD